VSEPHAPADFQFSAPQKSERFQIPGWDRPDDIARNDSPQEEHIRDLGRSITLTLANDGKLSEPANCNHDEDATKEEKDSGRSGRT
jgi:hypothetical protein